MAIIIIYGANDVRINVSDDGTENVLLVLKRILLVLKHILLVLEHILLVLKHL